MILRWSLGAFLIGCAFALLVSVPGIVAYGAILGCGIGAILFRSQLRAHRIFLISALCTIGILRVVLPGEFRETPSTPTTLGVRNEMRGTVVSQPRISGNKQRMMVATPEGKILIQAGLYPRYREDDRILFSCTLTQPEGSDAYLAYLVREQVAAVCRYPSKLTIETRQESRFGFSIVRERISERIARTFPRPSSDLLTGILIGTNPGFSSELRDAFQRTGLMHIVAVSGSNLALVSIFFFRMMLMFKAARWASSLLVIVGLVGYTLLTGASSSTIRACVMAGLGLLAPLLGRVSVSVNAILIAAASMIAVTPSALVDDLSFQLSFLATIGLVALSPHLERYFVWVPSRFGMRTTLSQTLSAIALTTPLVLMVFHTVSLVAVLANIIVVPLIPFIMIGGGAWLALSGGIGLIGYELPAFFSWPLWLLLEEPIVTATHFSRLPFASIALDSDRLAVAGGIALYATLAVGWFVASRGNRRRKEHL